MEMVAKISESLDVAHHAQLAEFLTALGDDALILGHRLSEWCGHAPQLEEDIALANIALDEIGRANVLLMYAGQLEGLNRDQDDLAFHRDTVSFRNLLLVEQPNIDFGYTLARQFLYDVYALKLFECMGGSPNPFISGVARKAAKEITYHVRHSRSWVLRLGDGTSESHDRIQAAFDELWTYTDEMFETSESIHALIEAGIIPDGFLRLRVDWNVFVTDTLTEATLVVPDQDQFMRKGGRSGQHSEHLGHILDEMQFLARSHPDASW
ncbi:MAG: phenylacetate-CoA oxygenase subunit PaaC [Rhodothermales bacterium]|nr:phenylacetate-CoA oxygenase subunit PaaC [Rhodothermales bacterium]